MTEGFVIDDEDYGDDEQFCSRCYAGVHSPEHHEKCVLTGYAEDGDSA
jgi:ribosomal protein S27AE